MESPIRLRESVNLFDVPTYHLEVSPGATYADLAKSLEDIVERYNKFLETRQKPLVRPPAAPPFEPVPAKEKKSK